MLSAQIPEDCIDAHVSAKKVILDTEAEYGIKIRSG